MSEKPQEPSSISVDDMVIEVMGHSVTLAGIANSRVREAIMRRGESFVAKHPSFRDNSCDNGYKLRRSSYSESSEQAMAKQKGMHHTDGFWKKHNEYLDYVEYEQYSEIYDDAMIKGFG